MRKLLCSALLAVAAAAAAHADAPHAAAGFSPAITAADYAARIEAISTDAMQGRKPGTVGEQRATAWIVEQFKQAGLQPGNHGQWLQDVPVVATTLRPATSHVSLTVGGATQALALHDEVVIGTLQAKPKISIKGSDVVFVGYGVDAPEYQWNDFAGIDVKGKTIVVLVNDPGYAVGDKNLFKGRTMTYYGRWTYKFEEAARKGAAACLVVHETDAAGYPFSVVQNSWGGPQLALPPAEDPAPRLAAAGWLSNAAARRLFAAAGLDFDQQVAAANRRGFKPVPLKAKADIGLDSTISHFTSHNVLGYLKGAKRPGETVIYSAHWDHLGVDPTLKGDSIYNGAVDNGDGVAGLVEIARAFKAGARPDRSLLFLAVTLEESGLLGSQYYAAHPVYPLATTVADINMDALPVQGVSRDMEVVGLGQSQLEETLKSVLAAEGRRISPEDSPEKGHYFRSDHFSFAKVGVPALDASGGTDLVQGGEAAGKALRADYTAHRYHTPLDNYDPHWDLSGTVMDVQTLYLVGRRLADSDAFPQWYPDSEFKAARAQSLERRQ